MMNTRFPEDYKLVQQSKVAGPETRVQYVNIDSRFKLNAKGSDSDFAVQMVDIIRNVTKVRVASVEFPNVPYTFSEYRGNNRITFVDASNTTVIDEFILSDGNYTISEIITLLNTFFSGSSNADVQNLISTYIPHNHKFVIQNSGTNDVYIYFDYYNRFSHRQADWGLGYNLGFRNRSYKLITGTLMNSECSFNTKGFNYYILQVNGYDIIQSPTKDNTIRGAAKVMIDVNTNEVLFQDGRNLLSFTFESQSPMDLTRVEVKVVDPYGEEIFPFCEPMSLTIEVSSIMQTQLYEQQRNRIFDYSKRE